MTKKRTKDKTVKTNSLKQSLESLKGNTSSLSSSFESEDYVTSEQLIDSITNAGLSEHRYDYINTQFTEIRGLIHTTENLIRDDISEIKVEINNIKHKYLSKNYLWWFILFVVAILGISFGDIKGCLSPNNQDLKRNSNQQEIKKDTVPSIQKDIKK